MNGLSTTTTQTKPCRTKGVFDRKPTPCKLQILKLNKNLSNIYVSRWLKKDNIVSDRCFATQDPTLVFSANWQIGYAAVFMSNSNLLKIVWLCNLSCARKRRKFVGETARLSEYIRNLCPPKRARFFFFNLLWRDWNLIRKMKLGKALHLCGK